jgi:2-dehydropantoate 2-reductase
MSKKIAMLATGANGSCIGADLIRAGLDVTMIDMWPAHVEAMRANGLTITTKDDTLNVPVTACHLCDICTLQEKFDVVFLVAKAYDSRWLTEFIEPYLAEDGVMVAIQNCMTAELVGEIVGIERTVGCVIELASQLFEPGRVHRSTPRERTWFGIGAFDPAHEDRVPEIVEILRHAGRVDVTDDILSAKWMKLIVNAMVMGSMAIIGTTPEQVMKTNGPAYAQAARAWFLRAGEEALAAGQSLGYKTVPIFGLKPEEVTNTNNLLETLLDRILHDVGPTAINTILQDYMKGRYSEVDLINGLVAEECRRIGRPSPASDGIVELSRRIDRGELKPDVANLDLVREQLGALA